MVWQSRSQPAPVSLDTGKKVRQLLSIILGFTSVPEFFEKSSKPIDILTVFFEPKWSPIYHIWRSYLLRSVSMELDLGGATDVDNHPGGSEARPTQRQQRHLLLAHKTPLLAHKTLLTGSQDTLLLAHELLSHVHEVVVVSISHIELAGRELNCDSKHEKLSMKNIAQPRGCGSCR